MTCQNASKCDRFGCSRSRIAPRKCADTTEIDQKTKRNTITKMDTHLKCPPRGGPIRSVFSKQIRTDFLRYHSFSILAVQIWPLKFVPVQFSEFPFSSRGGRGRCVNCSQVYPWGQWQTPWVTSGLRTEEAPEIRPAHNLGCG